MAIKSNKKIDFEYEYESPSGAFYSISLRFYHSEEYGPTIAFLDSEGDSVMDLPAGIFPEVTEYLVSQGIVEGSARKPLALPQMPTKQTRPTILRPALPKPKIISTAKVVHKNEENEQDLKALADQERLDAIYSAVDGQMPTHSLSSNVEQEQLSEDEIASIMADRATAPVKTDKASAKAFRRKE